MMAVKRELDGWCPTEGELAVYEEWRAHKTYPYAGGFLDQPQWFFDLRRKCDLLEELTRLNNGLRESKDAKKGKASA